LDARLSWFRGEVGELGELGAARPRVLQLRAAVYDAVPFADRAAAHLRIADTVRDQPDRYAWHLAAAALEPDERLTTLLEDTAA
jgi:hypothetical protein